MQNTNFKVQENFPGIKEDFNLQIENACHVSVKIDSGLSIQKHMLEEILTQQKTLTIKKNSSGGQAEISSCIRKTKIKLRSSFSSANSIPQSGEENLEDIREQKA